MAPRRAGKKQSQPTIGPESHNSEEESGEGEMAAMEEEFHTDPEDEDDEDDESVPELDGTGEEGYHTASSDESPEPTNANDPPLLPLELLQAKPATTKSLTIVDWERMTTTEKKALRDERGISMRQLREEITGTGVIAAGRAAQRRRGMLRGDKVAGSRVAKKTKRKGSSSKMEMSGKQRMMQDKARQSRQRRAGGRRKRT